MKLAYFDCIAGISGDMALGALIDAGADLDDVRAHLTELPLEPFDLDVDEVDAGGLRATRVNVRTTSAGVIRTYASIRALLEQADLPPEAQHVAHRIFHRLAVASAHVHRKEVETVTFHEADAVESIVDIVGTALGLTMLGVERVFASPVPTGLGMTKTDHGVMPVPTPTVVELLRGAPLYSKGATAELTTQTGAAILAATAEGYGDVPPMRLEAVGYGAGTLRLDFPDVLRVLIGDEVAMPAGDPVLGDRPGLRVVRDLEDDRGPDTGGA